MIKQVYICDHCGREYHESNNCLVNGYNNRCLCEECFAKWLSLHEKHTIETKLFFNEISAPTPENLRMEGKTDVLQILYEMCYSDVDKVNKYGTIITAQDILNVAEKEGVVIKKCNREN